MAASHISSAIVDSLHDPLEFPPGLILPASSNSSSSQTRPQHDPSARHSARSRHSTKHPHSISSTILPAIGSSLRESSSAGSVVQSAPSIPSTSSGKSRHKTHSHRKVKRTHATTLQKDFKLSDQELPTPPESIKPRSTYAHPSMSSPTPSVTLPFAALASSKTVPHVLSPRGTSSTVVSEFVPKKNSWRRTVG